MFFANGLTRRLPVTFPPLLAAGLEEGLNLSNLKSMPQEGRNGSDEVLLGTSVFPSSETGMSGNF